MLSSQHSPSHSCLFSLGGAGKRKGSDSDSYDEDDGVEGSSEQDDIMEKDLIAASKVTTQVCLPANS